MVSTLDKPFWLDVGNISLSVNEWVPTPLWVNYSKSRKYVW